MAVAPGGLGLMNGTAKLYLLGRFRLETSKAEPVEIPSLKGRALLTNLACARGHKATREQLALLLWNDSARRQARQNLRQVLFKVQRILAAQSIPILRVGSDMVELAREALWVDAWDFATLAGDGGRHALERIGRLYRGEFVHDLSVEAPAFNDWLSERRAHYQDRALLTLTALIEIQRRLGDVNAAIATAYRALEIDPCEEAAHRDLMALLSAQGLRAAALKQHRTCQTILRRELDVAPDLTTEALYRQLRGGGAMCDPAVPG